MGMEEQVDRAALAQWEEVYKRGLLTFWILLLLNEREMYAYEMRASIAEFSQGTIDVDDNSIYRALKRFAEAGFVHSDLRASEAGPARRYFTLTPAGLALLAGFIERNLLVFQTPRIVESIRRVLKQFDRTMEESHVE
jgi:PadR family transcriptional regulator, regulatory protein PadR